MHKGDFLAPSGAKNSPISFDWLIRSINEVLNFGIYLNFTVAIVT